MVHAGSAALPLNTPQLWNAWSWLDVWPDAKWVTAPATASALLQRAFDYQINRLFWPRSLKIGAGETQLPAHLWKMLNTSLKAVYLYGSYARGDYRQGSDVDVMILLKDYSDYWKEYMRSSDYVSDISLKYDITVSSLLMKEIQWKESDMPVLRNIRREGVPA